jgi:plasmid stabilization system protein ParE
VKPLVLDADAEDELYAAVDWYEAKRPGLGFEMLDAVQEAFVAVRERPASFPRWLDDLAYRKAHVERFPYIVFFELRESEIRVVAIAHRLRKPGYWSRR